jgi:hypothetical protein
VGSTLLQFFRFTMCEPWGLSDGRDEILGLCYLPPVGVASDPVLKEYSVLNATVWGSRTSLLKEANTAVHIGASQMNRCRDLYHISGSQPVICPMQ